MNACPVVFFLASHCSHFGNSCMDGIHGNRHNYGSYEIYVIRNRFLLLCTMGSTAPSAPIPPQARSKNLRACLLCSIIQTPIDFRRSGCPNCEDIMQVNRPLLTKALEIIRNTDVVPPFLLKCEIFLRAHTHTKKKTDERFTRSDSGVYDDAFRRDHCGH